QCPGHQWTTHTQKGSRQEEHRGVPWQHTQPQSTGACISTSPVTFESNRCRQTGHTPNATVTMSSMRRILVATNLDR
ncbi:hypothetical protein, partial [Pseudonocardia sp.]|uniref:hypothetical protein n=1 Tax=Pseudonocardia sp. TaxID=60912 RepID=UPI00260F29E4